MIIFARIFAISNHFIMSIRFMTDQEIIESNYEAQRLTFCLDPECKEEHDTTIEGWDVEECKSCGGKNLRTETLREYQSRIEAAYEF